MRYLLSLSVMIFAVQHVHSTCSIPKPTGLHSTAVTSCDVTMVWDASQGASYYVFWYEKKGSTTPTTVNVGTSTSFDATGLLAKQQYNFKVEAFCTGGTTQGYSTLVQVTTLTCSAISNLTVSSITSS